MLFQTAAAALGVERLSDPSLPHSKGLRGQNTEPQTAQIKLTAVLIQKVFPIHALHEYMCEWQKTGL